MNKNRRKFVDSFIALKNKISETKLEEETKNYFDDMMDGFLNYEVDLESENIVLRQIVKDMDDEFEM